MEEIVRRTACMHEVGGSHGADRQEQCHVLSQPFDAHGIPTRTVAARTLALDSRHPDAAVDVALLAVQA